MSSGEGALQNRIAPEEKPIKTCHQLLKLRDFKGARYIVQMNQLVSTKRHDEFEKVGAICDVIIAAETRLPNGILDYYGMIRMPRPGPVLWDEFEKLMNLLDEMNNPFPYSQEAVEWALLGWSMLSNPLVKWIYDFAISPDDDLETQGIDQSNDGLCGEGGKGGVDKGKRNTSSLNCSNLSASEYLKGIQATNGNPLPPAEKRQAPHNRFCSNETSSFVPEKHNVGSRTDVDVVVISDDEVEYEDEDDKEIMPIARAAKLCIVNGKRVKLIPLKKKQK